MAPDQRSIAHNITALIEAHRFRSARQVVFLQAGLDPSSPATVARAPMTFEELGRACETAAAGLRRIGLAPGDRVLVFLPMSGPMYVAMFASQRCGAIAVFLDSWARREQLGVCAALTEPRMMIAPENAYLACRHVPEIGAIPLKVVVGPHRGVYAASLEEIEHGRETSAIEPVLPGATALITFTTGSSGRPKGADRTHAFLVAQHAALRQIIPYRAEDRDLPVFPIFSLNNVASGVTTVLPAIDLAQPRPSDGATLASQIRDHAVSCCTLSPALLRGVASHCGESGVRLEGLRRVVTGGAPISREDVAAIQTAAPRAEILVLYGSTEAEPIAHITGAEMLAQSDAPGTLVGPFVPGLDHQLLRVNKDPISLDGRGWEPWLAPPGRPGEVAVAGDHVCRGYYKDDEAFRRAKVVDHRGRVWHRTGDVGYLDQKGYLHLVGRVHNAILRAGELLYPVTPEILMRAVDGVRNGAYLGLPDPELGEAAVAVISLTDAADRGRVEDAVRHALRGAGVAIDRVLFVPEIPMDPRHHSKVEYEKLRATLLGGGH